MIPFNLETKYRLQVLSSNIHKTKPILIPSNSLSRMYVECFGTFLVADAESDFLYVDRDWYFYI